MDTPQQVIAHYGDNSVDTRLAYALEIANRENASLTWSDLIPLDQFHVGGIAATRDLGAALAGVVGSDDLGELLDVGCGLGGPSRFLAATYQCHVTGIDLTPTFVEVAEKLTRRVGLTDAITYRQANALDLPFADSAFDHAWTQHVAMNIQDRAGLYGSIHRVLKPGGLLAIYDIVAGDGRALKFPVPWASVPEISFLVTPDEMRAVLTAAGFTEITWVDKTETYIGAVAGPPPGSPPPPGLHVPLGPEFAVMADNLRQNMEEGRVHLIQTILRKR